MPQQVKFSDWYTPNAQQYKAHTTTAFETFYGGAAFGGKSWFLLFEALRHCLVGGRNARAILFRRTYPELEDSLIEESLRVYPEEIGVYNQQKHMWTFGNGSTLRFRNLEHKKDVDQYRSAQFTLVAFDELSTFQEYQYLYLLSRCRSNDPTIKARVLSASNPTGIGHGWVKKRFKCGREYQKQGYRPEAMFNISLGKSGRKSTVVFIPARATDNVQGMSNDPDYVDRLRLLPIDDQRALIDGDWDIFVGQAFSEWDPTIHICAPFYVPDSWAVFQTMDWGYSTPFWIGWIAVEPTHPERYYLIDEWYGARETSEGATKGLEMAAPDVRRGIEERERGHDWKVAYRIAPPDLWSRHGEEKSTADLFLPMTFRKAERDRLAGKQMIHTVLRVDPDTLKPRFQSFSPCKALNETIGDLVRDEANPEDVDTRQTNDHPYDGLRYGLASRRVIGRGTRLTKAERAAIRRTHRVPVMT